LLTKVVGVIFGVALLAILSLAFTNQMAMAAHNSVNGVHGVINTDIAAIKRDVEWIRRKLEESQ